MAHPLDRVLGSVVIDKLEADHQWVSKLREERDILRKAAKYFAEENVSDHFPLPTEILPNQETFILKVKGDSMINVGIFDGDYLMVAKQNTCSDGEVVVALVEDSATVKRFYKEKGYIRLQPENDTMEDIIVNDCQILGKAIGLIRVGL